MSVLDLLHRHHIAEKQQQKENQRQSANAKEKFETKSVFLTDLNRSEVLVKLRVQ